VKINLTVKWLFDSWNGSEPFLKRKQGTPGISAAIPLAGLLFSLPPRENRKKAWRVVVEKRRRRQWQNLTP